MSKVHTGMSAATDLEQVIGEVRGKQRATGEFGGSRTMRIEFVLAAGRSGHDRYFAGQRLSGHRCQTGRPAQ